MTLVADIVTFIVIAPAVALAVQRACLNLPDLTPAPGSTGNTMEPAAFSMDDRDG